ncbi:MAG: GAF domain-containing protein, partial [Mycobacterium sp.]
MKVGRTWRFKRSQLDAGLDVTRRPVRRSAGAHAPPDAGGQWTEPYSADTSSLLSDARRWSQQLERIDALSRELSRSRDVLAVGEAVANQIASVIDWHGLRFFIVEPDLTLRAIVLRSTVPHYAHQTPDIFRIHVGEGLAGHVAASRVAEIVSDVRADPRGAKIPGTDDVDESMIIVPLLYEDAVLGVLVLIRLGKGAFDATDLRLTQIVGAQAAVALSNARQL